MIRSRGGPGVTVRVGTLDAEGQRGFYVEDDGPGVPPADRATVFEWGHATTGAGTGFGLAIVDELADAHGWEIGLEESADGGARFEVAGVRTDG